MNALMMFPGLPGTCSVPHCWLVDNDSLTLIVTPAPFVGFDTVNTNPLGCSDVI